MTIPKINKSVKAVFVYSLLIKLICCWSCVTSDACYIAFPVFQMIFTWLCIDKYRSEDYTSWQIVTTILTGTLILTLPVHIFDFYSSLGSLPLEPLSITGILAGWLLASKRKIWLLLLILLAFLAFTVYFPEWWHNWWKVWHKGYCQSKAL